MKQPKHFYVAAKAVIYNPKLQKVLVLERTDHKGKKFYDIPGGRIDGEEDIPETIERELKEEVLNLGDNYKVGKLLNAYRLSHNVKNDMGLFLLQYKVESDIEEVQLSSEHDGYMWVNEEELDELMNDNKARLERDDYEALKSGLK